MRELGVQDALAALVALAALGWLAARWLRARRRPGCADCPGCALGAPPGAPRRDAPATPPGAGGTIVPLSELTGRR